MLSRGSAEGQVGEEGAWDGTALPQNVVSRLMVELNQAPPRNQDLFPVLEEDRIVIVMYVHNRPRYLQLALEGLSQIDGINRTLLVISHDGFYQKMNELVKGVRFCQVKQLYFPYSPHNFAADAAFPGASPRDCQGKQLRLPFAGMAEPPGPNCTGDPDSYGSYRSTRIVSLKHHWWWLMNTVWDGLTETRALPQAAHVSFLEEDHYTMPNAYGTLRALVRAKAARCPECIAVNLAPSDYRRRGQGARRRLVAERMGNLGYTFNRTIWERIHASAEAFCMYDDYNWDFALSEGVLATWNESAVFSLCWSRPSAVHFGKCGLHQGAPAAKGRAGAKGHGSSSAAAGCTEGQPQRPQVLAVDRTVGVTPDAPMQQLKFRRPTRRKGFKGYGGWGDPRDHQLCRLFGRMYRSSAPPPASAGEG